MKFYTNVAQDGRSFRVRGYENGQPFDEEVPFKPFLFVPSRNKDGEFRSHKGRVLDKRVFEDIYKAKDYVKMAKSTSGMEVYGMTDFVYPFINEYFPGTIEYDPKRVSVVFLDIETDSQDGFADIDEADKAITAITVRKNGWIVSLGIGEYKAPTENIHYIRCENEEELLQKFLRVWNTDQFRPDIVSGWNIEFFDIPYLVNRITRVLGPADAKRLSPWKKLSEREVEIYGRMHTVYVPSGVSVVDYLQLYKKFAPKKQPSYKLDDIALYELKEQKLDFSEYSSLDDLYQKNHQKFIEYNIHDATLVYNLDQKLKLIEQLLAIAYDAKVNFADAFTSVRMWDVIIHNYLLEKKIAVPNNLRGIKDAPTRGAVVKDPQVGMHKWLVSFDLDSLYPHLIMQYNISPETLVEGDSEDVTVDWLLGKNFDSSKLIEDNLTMAASGFKFDRDYQGFLPALMEMKYKDRVTYKKKLIEAKKQYEKHKSPELEADIARFNSIQLAKKIQLNSCYGALSNVYFRWFDPRLAESITLSGQLSIRWVYEAINRYLNTTLGTVDKDYVVGSDTDSMYICLSGLVDKYCQGKDDKQIVTFLDKTCEGPIAKAIDKSFQELAGYLNAYEQKMRMKRESISQKGIWTSKKHYLLNLYNDEGVQYDQPKLKMVGIEAVRSSTPIACRKNIEEALKVVMNSTEDDLVRFIDKFREEFAKLPFEVVANTSSVRGLSDSDEYANGQLVQKGYKSALSIYKKGTPMHVKASLVYNDYLIKNGLDKKYPLIREDEKIKFCYLKQPNPFMCKVIASPSGAIDFVDINKYIDYNAQFDKSFVEPLKTVLNVIGWQTEKRSTLDFGD